MKCTTKNAKYQDAFVALSMANLMFLRVWRELLFVNDADAYWMPDYTFASYLAVILNVIWIAAALFWATLLIRKVDNSALTTVGRLGFLLLFVFPLEYLRTLLDIDESTIHGCLDHAVISGAIGLGIAAFAAYLLIWQLARTVRTLRWVLLALAPLAAITLPQAVYHGALAMQEERGSTGGASAGPKSTRGLSNRPRIIWLLFDELDSRLAFIDRPGGIALPNFDRLRAECVFALNGESHGQSTSTAIPSFFTGRIVSDIKVQSNELQLCFQGQPEGQFVSLADSPTIFSAVRNRGGRSAVIGIYHPYHRLLGEDLEYCSAYMINTYTPTATDSVWTEMSAQILGITPLFRRINAVKTYRGILRECIDVAGDPQYDILYVHVPVPHGPHIYRRESGKFTLVNTSKDGYLDNLVLADIFLGEVRRSLEEKVMWDDSVIVLTSDHELRHVWFGDNQRVAKIPLMMKMPGQKEQVAFENPFSPKMITKDLLLAVLDGQVRTPEDVVLWLNRETAPAESGSR